MGPGLTGCTRDYFFTTYVNQPVEFWFNIDPVYYGFQMDARWNIYNNNVQVLGAAFGPAYAIDVDYFNGAVSGLPQHQFWTPTTPGNYKIVYQNYDALYQWYDAQVAYFSVIPKIEKAWIEATPICVDNSYQAPADNKIHFKIKTFPDIASVMISSYAYTPGTYTSGTPNICDYEQATKIGIDCKVQLAPSYGPATFPITFPVSSEFRRVNAASLSSSTHDNNNVNGTRWTSYNTALQDDFYVLFNDPASPSDQISDFITGTSKGFPLEIKLNITDGVSLNQTLTAPIIINFPLGTSFAPAAALMPSAYHSKEYTIPYNNTGSPPPTVETWTPADNPVQRMYGSNQSVYRIQKSITIPPGQTLIIQDMQIEMGPDAHIYVQTLPGSNKPGGILSLDNSTVTAVRDCGNESNFWGGIQVWGDATRNQAFSFPGGGSYQGWLLMNNHSTISNANWGIVTNGPNASKPYDRDGGIITASNSSFIDNIRSVNFAPYPVAGVLPAPGSTGVVANQPYASNFTNCDFKVSTPTFIGFISGWGVKGIPIKGCRFVNQSLARPGAGSAVYGSDFGVNIDQMVPFTPAAGYGTPVPSEFYGLDNAVQLKNIGSRVTTATIKHSIFGGNTIGVSSDGLPAPQVRYNTFTVAGGTEEVNGIGVFVHTGSGYNVSNNSFSPYLGQPYATGVLISETGGGVNVVHSNDYYGLWCGNLSNFLNRDPNPQSQIGLQFLCNTNAANRHDIAARGTLTLGNTVEGMAGYQGAPTQAAGNTFSSGALYNIYNRTNEVQPVNYYYSLGQIPNTYFGIYAFSATPNDCFYPESYPGNYNNNNNDPPQHPTGMGMRIAHFLNDSTGTLYRDSLYLAVAGWASPYADLLKTDLLIEDSNIEAANTIYNGIVAARALTGKEAVEFSTWGRRLVSISIALRGEGKTAKDLSADQVQSLESVADSAYMWAKVRAQNWLNLYDGRVFSPVMLFPTDSSTGNGSQRVARPAAQPYYGISPNPATDQLQVSFSKEEDKKEVFSLMDITGRIILQATLNGQSGKTYIDVRPLQAGIYLYRVTEGGLTKASGKITRQ